MLIYTITYTVVNLQVSESVIVWIPQPLQERNQGVWCHLNVSKYKLFVEKKNWE